MGARARSPRYRRVESGPLEAVPRPGFAIWRKELDEVGFASFDDVNHVARVTVAETIVRQIGCEHSEVELGDLGLLSEG